jgi:very-short-patch-repair endonuclease
VPRFLYNAAPISVKEKKERARDYRVPSLTRWIDPFYNVHGTLPEKMVYEALSRRKIQFYFLNDLLINIPELKIRKEYQADFIIPSLRLIIEVQGAYWHSKPKALENDAYKFALYEQMGYKVLAWWDFDIMTRLTQLFQQEPLLAKYAATSNAATELKPKKRTKVDTSQGIRTLNKRRATRLLYRKKTARFKQTRKRKDYGSYTAYNK